MKDKSKVTLLKQQFFCYMFSKIFLDHILNLRISKLLEFFDFSGFPSNLKPSLPGVGKISLPPRKSFNKKKKSFMRFRKISDKFENSVIFF